jgi:hypothetical protein
MILKSKLLAGFCFLGFLLACDQAPRYGEPLECDYTPSDRLSLVVLLYDDISDVEQAYRDYMRTKGQRIDKSAVRNGFCILRSDNHRICHLPKIRGQRDDDMITLWGHEFAHVVCGDWHDKDFEW